jgi:hypothetical protein
MAHRSVLPLFQIMRCFSFFQKRHVSRRILVCRFTHFGPYVVHIEISKTSYNSEQMVCILKILSFKLNVVLLFLTIWWPNYYHCCTYKEVLTEWYRQATLNILIWHWMHIISSQYREREWQYLKILAKHKHNVSEIALKNEMVRSVLLQKVKEGNKFLAMSELHKTFEYKISVCTL